MDHPLINPADPIERQREKLLTIVEALMRRVEQGTDQSGAAYAQFERAAMLEDQVRARTRDLERALDLLNQSNARLADANRATEAARQNLANAIETVQEGFALFGPDEVLVMCNARFGKQMSDISARLVPGLRFADYVDLVSRSRDLSLPEGETPQDWAVARMARHRDAHVIFNVQFRGDRWVQVSEHRTADGGTVILQTDVTDIIRAEREERGKLLDDQARVVRATLDHISQGVCIFDARARMIGWNARAGELLAVPRARFRAGLAFGDLLDRLRDRIVLGEGVSPAALRDWAYQDSPRLPLRFEMRRDGSAGGGGMALDAFAQEMPDRGFVFSFTDVSTERRAIAALSRANETLEARVAARTLELEDALANAERANATRSRFVAAASHDLLQPLSAAKLFLASMEDEPLGARSAEALGKARSALESVETILDALLDISRLESGRLSVSIGPVALGPMLERLGSEFAPVAAAKGLRLHIRPTDRVVLSDATYLRRILQNLIANALRYTDRGGVVVGLRLAGPDAVRMEVADTGPGIPAHEHQAIFREFHRLNARASASEGLGLGLAIVERAAALLGHDIRLLSRMGHGSRFSVRLGLAPAMPARRPELPETTLQARHRQDLIGLLVENDASLRRALVHLLEGWGVSMLETAGADEATALLDEIGIQPDFMLIDNQLGNGPTGLELIATLSARYGPIPVRLITAERSAALHAQTAAQGVAILYKPIDTRTLERFIASVGQPGPDLSIGRKRRHRA
ncbi:hybrid sensor histidine kinase/response regulator [Pararhodobacter sp.]|uniref:hybrid sensor histidine kinase/response regulator n=1 Tax=Pararhodobacter sp. TaxID=2127056 RepID=UPI002FDE71C8